MGHDALDTLDAQQRRAVEVRHNVVISAGAGSGKTRVLTERYMGILREGSAGVPEILALTFTRKAAAEMFSRIYGMLRTEVAASPVLQRELRRFDEARISTIDSFCAGVLRDGAARFGLPSHVETDDRRFGRVARRHAVSFLMRYGDEPGIAGFVRLYGIDGTVDRLLVPLISRYIRIADDNRFIDHYETQQRWLETRKRAVETEIDVVLGRVERLTPGSPSAVSAHEGCIARGGNYAELHTFLQGVKKTFGSKGDAQLLKEELNLLLEKKGSSQRGLLPDWYAITRTQERAGELHNLYTRFDDLRETVLAERRAAGLLSHLDVMELAVQILRDDPELRRVYRDQFRYIMIDEFQDNNASQRDLLFLLAADGDVTGVPTADRLEPSKLFFVGDQKQSIYRFRGADVSVFRRLADDVAASLPVDHPGESELELATNYRSEPDLIAFFNDLFPRVFGTPTKEYEADFSPLLSRDADETVEPAVTVAWVPPSDDDGELDESDPVNNTFAEGAWIAAEIADLTSRRGYRPGEIAILLRSSSGQQMFERMLRRQGIPYQTQAIRSLFTEAPAHDIYALLQLVFFPSDREAFTAYLRSPLVMLSDDALVRVLQAPNRQDLFSPPAEIEPEEVEKLGAAAELYNTVAVAVDRLPVHEVIRRIWDEGGYRYAILHRAADHSYLEHYDYLFSLALQYRDRSTVEFLDYLREQMGNTEKLDELERAPADDAIQIMTVHKSKGLEFPVVFVADCDRQVQSRPEVLWDDPELGVTVRLPPPVPGSSSFNVIEAQAADEEERRGNAELARLLYVAATRAKHRLYFTAAERGRRRGTSFFRMLDKALGLRNGEVETPGILTTQQIPSLTERDLRRVPVPQGARRNRADAAKLLEGTTVREWRARQVETTPSEVNLLWQARQAQQAQQGGPAETQQRHRQLADVSPADRGGADDGTVLGTLTHLLLELRISAGVPGPSSGAVPSRETWRPDHPDVAPLIQSVGTPREREALCRQSWELTDSFLESTFARDLLASELHGRVYCEYPFLLQAGDPVYYLNGKIDLLVERDEAVTIVDFKTDQAIEPSHYTAQMAVYRRAAEVLLDKPTTVWLFFLRTAEAFDTTAAIRRAGDIDQILTTIDLPEDRRGGVDLPT